MSFLLRGLLERTTQRFVFRRHLSRADGGLPIYVSTAGGLKFLLKDASRWDPVLCGLAREYVKPNAVVWDVGANLGLFSVAAAHRAGPSGRVVAVEPDTWLVEVLRRSALIQPSHSAPLEVLPCAVASSIAPRKFSIAKRARAANYLEGYGTSQTGGSSESQFVVAITLDWLSGFFPPPDVLKIDVEGAEWEVLQGAAKVIEAAGPVVICEVSSGNSRDVAEYFRQRDYKVFDGNVETNSRHSLELAPWTTIAIPRSKAPSSPD